MTNTSTTGLGKAADDWAMTTFMRDAWYVGAYTDEVTQDKPFQRILLNEPLVFYRTESGEVAVLHDMCPHRFAPLSTGRVVGESIECGYHGFAFAKSGACTCIPGQDKIPSSVKVRSYPICERWGFVFVWMGDPALADEGKLPPLYYHDHPKWAGKGDRIPVGGNYALLRDNLADLTHAKFLHLTTLATDAVTEFPITVEKTDEKIKIMREMVNIERTSPLWTKVGGFTDRVTQWQNVQFTPPNTIIIKMGVHSSEESSEDKRIEFRILNHIVPESDNSCHYFWAIMRNFDIDNAVLTEETYNFNRSAFLEDKWMVEEQQQMMSRMRPDVSMVGPHDRGVIMIQKWMRELIQEEAKPTELQAAE